jgi:hypothetical protein
MQNNQLNQPIMVRWILWLAFLFSVFFYMSFLASADAEEAQMDAFLVVMLFVPFFLSIFIRWMLLPKANTEQQLIVLFVVGMAIAESIIFFGLFLFPFFKTIFLIFTVVGILQYCPLFIKSRSNVT